MTEREKTVRELVGRETYSFDDLVRIVTLLRGEGGCPWDREQTHASVRRCMIEEAYEVAEAIDREDATLLCEELGDVLFQVLFHAELEREAGRFSCEDVVTGIARKMIRRHPHVFGDAEVSGGEDALQKWEEIKIREKSRTTLSSRLRAIPPILPALLRAQKVWEKLPAAEEDRQPDRLALIAAEFAQYPTRETLGTLLYETVGIAARRGLDAEESLFHRTEQAISGAETRNFDEKN